MHVIWKKPEEAQEILGRLQEMNVDLYRFEKMLESRETTN